MDPKVTFLNHRLRDSGCLHCGAMRRRIGLLPLKVPTHELTTIAEALVLECESCHVKHLQLHVNTASARKFNVELGAYLRDDTSWPPIEPVLARVQWADRTRCIVEEYQFLNALLHRMRFPSIVPEKQSGDLTQSADELVRSVWRSIGEVRAFDFTAMYQRQPELIERRRRMN